MSQPVFSRGLNVRSLRIGRGGGAGPSELGTTAVLLAAWLVLLLGTGAAEPAFLAVDTFTAISYTAVGLAPICLGLAFVTVSGGMVDLSGGMVAAAGSVICGTLLSRGWGTAPTILTVLVFGTCVGAINGALIARVGVDPVIATFGVSFVGIGIIELQSLTLVMPSDTALRAFSFGKTFGLTNLAWVALAMFLAAEVFLRTTRRGRHVLAIGGNPIAAMRQGISRSQIRFLTFSFSGLCASVGGLMLAGPSDIVRPDIANVRQFEAVAAVLLAGIMLVGGRGRVLALVASILVISTIPVAVTTLGFSSAWSVVMQGLVLGIALAVDGRRGARKALQ